MKRKFPEFGEKTLDGYTLYCIGYLMDSKELVHRLNRIQGQIDAIKRNIQEGEGDCAQNIRLLKAATNALKKFGQAYVESHLDHCLVSESIDRKTLDKDLREVVSSAFSM